MPPKKAPDLDASLDKRFEYSKDNTNEYDATVVVPSSSESDEVVENSPKRNKTKIRNSKASIYTTRKQQILDFIEYETKRFIENRNCLIQSPDLQKEIKLIAANPKSTTVRKLYHFGMI